MIDPRPYARKENPGTILHDLTQAGKHVPGADKQTFKIITAVSLIIMGGHMLNSALKSMSERNRELSR
jgi:hypothetical protein